MDGVNKQDDHVKVEGINIVNFSGWSPIDDQSKHQTHQQSVNKQQSFTVIWHAQFLYSLIYKPLQCYLVARNIMH